MLERLEHQLAVAQALAHIGSWEWELLSDRLTRTEIEPGSPIEYGTGVQYIHLTARPVLQRHVDHPRIE